MRDVRTSGRPVPDTGPPVSAADWTPGLTALGLDPDDLPDGLAVADEHGRVICFNAAAGRITGLRPSQVLGLPLERALPLEDLEGRRWWACTDPYGGLATRVGQPERNLYSRAAARCWSPPATSAAAGWARCTGS